ncbi:hypothetical protein BOTBODRAFT_54541 [Botryobasidium botryosum FD-172 SS1]|uniref:Uncharacterized protein n=1 Tax=Botryobasidium botryosum (strain FD-172 SS1) TaxID=930990 RepID=A0A067MVQ5_BOTB1|nr:hypothetical protein BOTBODRAFT_54541 [Botryobasidium botryosum FD-172 SS1]
MKFSAGTTPLLLAASFALTTTTTCTLAAPTTPNPNADYEACIEANLAHPGIVVSEADDDDEDGGMCRSLLKRQFPAQPPNSPSMSTAGFGGAGGALSSLSGGLLGGGLLGGLLGGGGGGAGGGGLLNGLSILGEVVGPNGVASAVIQEVNQLGQVVPVLVPLSALNGAVGDVTSAAGAAVGSTLGAAGANVESEQSGVNGFVHALPYPIVQPGGGLLPGYGSPYVLPGALTGAHLPGVNPYTGGLQGLAPGTYIPNGYIPGYKQEGGDPTGTSTGPTLGGTSTQPSATMLSPSPSVSSTQGPSEPSATADPAEGNTDPLALKTRPTPTSESPANPTSASNPAEAAPTVPAMPGSEGNSAESSASATPVSASSMPEATSAPEA